MYLRVVNNYTGNSGSPEGGGGVQGVETHGILPSNVRAQTGGGEHDATVDRWCSQIRDTVALVCKKAVENNNFHNNRKRYKRRTGSPCTPCSES